MSESIERRPVFLALLIAALVFTATCRTADAGGPLPSYDVFYGLGLSNCTEACRPFGVLSFGIATLGDGNVICECECMPGPELDTKEDDKKNKAQEEDSPDADSGKKTPGGLIRYAKPKAVRYRDPGPVFALARPLPITRP